MLNLSQSLVLYDEPLERMRIFEVTLSSVSEEFCRNSEVHFDRPNLFWNEQIPYLYFWKKIIENLLILI